MVCSLRIRPLLSALLFFGLLLAAPAAAQEQDGPPLIDRQLFFGNPEVSGAQLSPDGSQVAFIKPFEGTRNLWVKERSAPFAEARPVTADDRPVPGYFWSQRGDYLLYVQDKGGNENFHVYAVDPSAEAGDEDDAGVPPARDLTPVEGVRAAIYSVPENAPGTMIVGLNDRQPAYHDVYRVNIETGERELLIQNDDEVGGYVFDLAGAPRLAIRQTGNGGTEMLRVEADGSLSEPVYTCTYEENCSPVRFHKNGEQVYMQTNKGPEADLSQLILFNPQTQETELVESDPEGEVDFGGAVFSDDTEELLATVYVGDRQRIYPQTEPFKQTLEQLRAQLPEGNLGISSSTEDMRYHTVSVSSDTDPGSVYLYDRQAGTTELMYRSRPELPSDQLAEMQAVRYTARDGLEIPAYLTIPKGKDAQNLPVVIFPHGGPWSRDTWGYDAFAQFLANRGYAVMQPNFRSSTGYGQAFLNAGNKTWGTGAMQHDITDGVQYLIDEGIADPERVGIFGGSYGGYATLAGVAFTPDLYAAAVPYVAPSNLITLIESFPAYWRPFLEGTWFKRVGDPEDPEDRADLVARSPLSRADEITTPLLVVHGANDPRVKQQESDQLVVALRERGIDVQYLVAPDEGHGFRSRENRLALAAAMEQFLAEHLGGRYQQEMASEIEERLAAITVDPAGVTLPDSLDRAQAEQAQTAPLPDADGSALAPGQMQYATTVETQGRSIDIDVTRTVTEATFEGQPVWRIIDRADTPLGASSDTVEVDRATLRPLRRSASGNGTITTRFTERGVEGSLEAQGQSIDLTTDLDAPALSDDGVGLEMFVAGLPLAEGYETTLRTFAPQRKEAVPLRVTVTGTETVDVPAGSFETYVVEIAPVEDDRETRTLHVRREAPHLLVRKTQPLPAQMGGGTATTVLASMDVASME